MSDAGFIVVPAEFSKRESGMCLSQNEMSQILRQMRDTQYSVVAAVVASSESSNNTSTFTTTTLLVQALVSPVPRTSDG